MLVDLARNDLGRVARAGSVRVNPYRSIERYSHVMHIVSGVCGELAPQRDAFDLFAPPFRGHAGRRAQGARRWRSSKSSSPVRRGLYGGTVGYFGAHAPWTRRSRSGPWCFMARSTATSRRRHRRRQPASAEHDEVLAKSAALLRALKLAEAGL